MYVSEVFKRIDCKTCARRKKYIPEMASITKEIYTIFLTDEFVKTKKVNGITSKKEMPDSLEVDERKKEIPERNKYRLNLPEAAFRIKKRDKIPNKKQRISSALLILFTTSE